MASSLTTCPKERVTEEMRNWQPTNEKEHLKKNHGKLNNKDGVEMSFVIALKINQSAAGVTFIFLLHMLVFVTAVTFY